MTAVVEAFCVGFWMVRRRDRLAALFSGLATVFSEEVSCQYRLVLTKRASWLWRALLNTDKVHLALIFANAGQKPVAGLKPEPVLGGNYSIIVAGRRHFE